MADIQQSQAVAIPAGFVMNAAGHLVPEHQVREHDKLRDGVARDLGNAAEHISALLADFKKQALADIADLIAVSSERYGVQLGGQKGNVSITTYDGQYKIERAYADRIVFTEEILAARELINQCISTWSEGRTTTYAYWSTVHFGPTVKASSWLKMCSVCCEWRSMTRRGRPPCRR